MHSLNNIADTELGDTSNALVLARDRPWPGLADISCSNICCPFGLDLPTSAEMVATRKRAEALLGIYRKVCGVVVGVSPRIDDVPNTGEASGEVRGNARTYTAYTANNFCNATT